MDNRLGIIVAALVTTIGVIMILPQQQQQVFALNPCSFADPSYDYNSTGSYTSGVEECNDFFYPEDRAGNRDYRTYEDPPVTAQEYGEFPLGDNAGDSSSNNENDDDSNDNNNEDVDPQVQDQIDKADAWLRYFNKGQMWNCPVGDVDCTIFGQNSPGSFTCQYLGNCDENAGGLPSGYPYTQEDIDETNQKADKAIADANRLLECLHSGTVC
jgi:hypothetical protein